MIVKYYINPITGRIIKSSGKTFNNLEKNNYSIQKDNCLYDIKSAKRCFSKLLRIYPDTIYPSSNFTNIPKTFNISFISGFRAFIKDGDNIIGFIDKNGSIYRLKEYININTLQKNVPIVIDYNNILPQIVEKLEKINDDIQKKVVYQISNTQSFKNVNILFNNVQKDFIPIKKKMDKKEHDKILNIYNHNLIKKPLAKSTFDIQTYPVIITPPITPPITPTILTYPEIKVPPVTSTTVSSSDISTISSSDLSSNISTTTIPIPIYKPPSSTNISTVSSSASEKDFELGWVNDSLIKKVIKLDSDKGSSNLKIIQDDKNNIIGYNSDNVPYITIR